MILIILIFYTELQQAYKHVVAYYFNENYSRWKDKHTGTGILAVTS